MRHQHNRETVKTIVVGWAFLSQKKNLVIWTLVFGTHSQRTRRFFSPKSRCGQDSGVSLPKKPLVSTLSGAFSPPKAVVVGTQVFLQKNIVVNSGIFLEKNTQSQKNVSKNAARIGSISSGKPSENRNSIFSITPCTKRQR